MPFIPIEKIRQLREAAKNGDARAKKILRAQSRGEDYSSDFDEFFAPKPEEPIQEMPATEPQKTKLQEFLEYNGVNEGDPEYQDTVDAFNEEFPDEKEPEEELDGKRFSVDYLIDGEKDLIKAYNEAIMQVMDTEGASESETKGIITDLEEMKKDGMDHLDRLRRMKSSIQKKEEPTETPEEGL